MRSPGVTATFAKQAAPSWNYLQASRYRHCTLYSISSHSWRAQRLNGKAANLFATRGSPSDLIPRVHKAYFRTLKRFPRWISFPRNILLSLFALYSFEVQILLLLRASLGSGLHELLVQLFLILLKVYPLIPSYAVHLSRTPCCLLLFFCDSKRNSLLF